MAWTPVITSRKQALADFLKRPLFWWVEIVGPEGRREIGPFESRRAAEVAEAGAKVGRLNDRLNGGIRTAILER